MFIRHVYLHFLACFVLDNVIQTSFQTISGVIVSMLVFGAVDRWFKSR